MTNKEFFNDKLIEIALDGKGVGVDKKTLEPCSCDDLECCNCVGCDGRCGERLKEWADSEYIEVCPFEKDELVEVSDDRKMWHLRYFSHINSDGMFVTFYNQKNSEGTILTTSWNYCRKYGTLGGLKKEDIRKFAKWIINNYLVVGELSEYTTDEILEEYEKEQTNG